MNQILNIEGDIEHLKTNLEKEKSVIKTLETKNQSVLQKLTLYDQSMNKGVGPFSFPILPA